MSSLLTTQKRMQDVALRPEARVLTLCARSQRTPAAEAALGSLLTRDLDWEWLRRQLFQLHGIEPLVDRAWKAHEGHVPTELKEEVALRARAVAFRNLQQLHELLRLIRILEHEGIPVIPFKGPMLAVQAYGNVAYRRFGDLDIIVPREHVACVRSLLMEQGYEPAKDLSDVAEKAYIDSQLGYEFVHDQKRTVVEVHWALFYEIYAFDLAPEEIWKRAQRISVAGQSVRALSPEDLLIYLCFHGTKHRWARLTWIADVAEVLQSSGDIDWQTTIKRSTTLGSLRMLLLGLYLSHAMLGTRLPSRVHRLLTKDQTVGKLATQVIEEWLFMEGDSDPSSELEVFWFHVQERERWRDRWPYIRHHLNLWAPFTN